MKRSKLALLALVFGSACNNGPDAQGIVGLDWHYGQSFHVAASYKAPEIMHEAGAVDLDGEALPQLGEVWSEEVVWSFQVVETALVPAATDSLYPYAVTASGAVASLSVLRAYVDPSLNDDGVLLESDPVIYLVFREDRDRLAAIVSFVNQGGERVEKAWSSKRLGRSYSVLSQSMLTELPTFLAPFSATWEDSVRVLENDSLVSSLSVDSVTTDVVYDDEMGGGLVVSRYEWGAPWPLETVAENVVSHLMSEEEISDRKAEMPFFLPEPPEDFDYRAALRSSIDIDQALTLDKQTMTDGLEVAAYEGYRPWAGYWWPTQKGELIFGYNIDGQSRDTFSDRVREEIDVFKLKMDELSEELRDMESEDEGYDEKVEEYRSNQGDLVTALKKFYDTLRQDLDGGRITIKNGEMTHVDGWSYALNDLSPMDKYGLVLYLQDSDSRQNPFYTSAWEILNSYNPGGENWWGHCNGWAAAAILTNEPTESVMVQAGDSEIEFLTGDIKGLLSETHYSTASHFYGERYNDEDDDVSDLSPAAFHRLVSFYLGEMGVPMVFDTTATEQVWNFPVWAATLAVDEITPEGAQELININTADLETLASLPDIGDARGRAIIEHREANGPFQAIEDIKEVHGIAVGVFSSVESLITVSPFRRTFDVNAKVTFTTDGVSATWVDTGDPKGFDKTYGYTLVTDAEGLVLEGTWDDEKSHPDFAWIPYDNAMTGSSRNSENPFVEYGTLLDVIGDSFQRE